MFQALSIGEFQTFHLNESTHVELLQFEDDIILIEEGSWINLWSIKALLRGFEFVSRLWVNFSKSILFGINLDSDFLQVGGWWVRGETLWAV